MLSDNIRNYRKKNNLSQEELAEKLGVSRQSVSSWETGQTQPTIENIIALSKIFNISSDMLLGNIDGVESAQNETPNTEPPQKNLKTMIIAICAVIVIIIGIIILASALSNNDPNTPVTPNPTAAETQGAVTPENFDLFTYCKEFAIQKGQLNGDYVIYQQPAGKYGGYKDEYFSISYWADSDRVEFCLHCPLSETQSHNFYLIMRGGFNGQYEYSSSKYYRDTGESFRYAMGYIDPSVFSDKYPLPCSTYEGSTDGQNDFMEQSRVGICDLISCLKSFVRVENMECDFSAFGFKNF